MNRKNPMSDQNDGKYTRCNLLVSLLSGVALMFVITGHSPADAEETYEVGAGASENIDTVGLHPGWELQPDSALAGMYGLGAKLVTPEVNSELAVILWDEARNNERRPVRSVSDDGNGNIQVNQLRMLSR